MAKKKIQVDDVVTRYVADTRQYIASINAVIKKVKELTAAEEKLQKLISKRK